jgi:hypothetical protein
MPTVPVLDFFLEYSLAAAVRSETNGFDVRIHHDSDKVAESDARLPSKLAARLGGICDKNIDFERPEIAVRDFEVPAPIEARIGEGFLKKLPDGVRLAGADDIVIRLILLDDVPNGFYVFGSVAPIAASIEVAEVESVGFASEYGSYAASDLAGNEGFATAGAFVIEENAVGGVEAVAFSIDAGHPVSVNLRGSVGAARLKGSEFALGGRSGAEDLGAGSLVEAGFATAATNGFEEASGAKAGDVAGIFGHVEADADVALRGEMIQFVRSETVDEAENPFGARQIAVVKEEASVGLVGILIDVVDALSVEGTGAPDDAVDLVSLRKKKFSKVGTILSGDAGNKSAFHGIEFRLLARMAQMQQECYVLDRAE